MRASTEAETLLWCMRPPLDLLHLRGPLPEKIAALRPEERPFRPATHSRFRSHLVVTETVNQARALERLIAAEAEALPIEAPSEAARAPVLDAKAVSAAQRRMLHAISRRPGEAVSAGVSDSLVNQLYKVALALDLYRGMDLRAYRGVLVSTQHSPIIRALIVAANEQAVPVVYVPHAPAADNSAYLDLPVGYAGLRGRGEREFYSAALGVPATLLDEVGNLASDVLSSPVPSLRPDAPGILALSPHPAPTIRRIFEAVAGDGLGPMAVAPHPRSDLDELRELLPAGWTLREDVRTIDLLAEGAPFLFHFSSGVAWESAALGVPTATVRLDDAPVSYRFLADERVAPAIRTPDDARGFAERARRGEVDRGALRDHAVAWCAVDGGAAAERLRELLERADGAGRPARLSDGWARGGAAVRRSWIDGTKAAR
ncbi:hypothetical protein J4H92_01350 [Leucobacter weissii]|uniref:Glycosyltransferase n=1 Tax=Leucobacter weissii TaxID=1983706 RepID=A0A939ML15_9MICO|nr:hypothetical protein [Leucobacter weissii]MBO1900592.1 hypothetical protein [Leucobacter weissii]